MAYSVDRAGHLNNKLSQKKKTKFNPLQLYTLTELPSAELQKQQQYKQTSINILKASSRPGEDRQDEKTNN